MRRKGMLVIGAILLCVGVAVALPMRGGGAYHPVPAEGVDAADTAWASVAAAPVMLMTPALGLFCGGLVHQKNLVSTLVRRLTIFCISGGTVVYVLPQTLVNPPGANGLLYVNPRQVLAHIRAVPACALRAFVGSVFLLKALGWVMGLRVGPDEEALGLDVTQHAGCAFAPDWLPPGPACSRGGEAVCPGRRVAGLCGPPLHAPLHPPSRPSTVPLPLSPPLQPPFSNPRLHASSSPSAGPFATPFQTPLSPLFSPLENV